MAVDRELLISLVQTRPVLWQDTHKDFKNRSVTDNEWQEVGKICGTTGDTAKKMWKNLKDQFRRELQKAHAMKSSSVPILEIVKWPFFEMMLFIREFTSNHTKGILKDLLMRENNTILSYGVDNLDTEPNSGISAIHEVSSQTITHDSSNNPSTSYPFRDPLQLSFEKRKRKANNLNEKYSEIQQKKVQVVENSQMQKSNDSSDLHFFKSLLPFIEPLSALDKLELRNKIQEVIIEKYREVQHMKSQRTVQEQHEEQEDVFHEHTEQIQVHQQSLDEGQQTYYQERSSFKEEQIFSPE